MLESVVANNIKVVGLDVDGVMTDEGVYTGMGPTGPIELKRFNIHDTVGIKLLQAAGLEVVIVSGRFSEATTIRAKELGITEVVQDPDARKLPAFEDILSRTGFRWDEAAFVGDDLPDIPLLKRVALPVTVQNGVAEVREHAVFITERRGGEGAIREFTEALLRARGQWREVVSGYLSERDEELRSVHGGD
jgi:3-deoxy-D-manno-octulosonate 8-phosphate phosphatase (KDO 8-P phosphatase)